MGQGTVYGLSEYELTMAEMLQTAGYNTAMVGKWHLGWPKPYHPAYHGFMETIGIPYSNDMGCTDAWKQCLYNDTKKVKQYANDHPGGGRVPDQLARACAKGQ